MWLRLSGVRIVSLADQEIKVKKTFILKVCLFVKVVKWQTELVRFVMMIFAVMVS
jgi:hypothetical protein